MRLGYACMNVTLGTRVRTCRLANATPERVRSLAEENLAGVREMARWNRAHGIGLLRLSSDLVPFAGRAEVAPGWRDDLADAFAETGRVLRECDQRVSAHPGQYTVLNSPRPEVVDAAVSDLDAQAAYFDLLGVPADLVIHLGGAYGDREAALDRFVRAVERLPDAVRGKLVVENDDVTWNLADALRAHDLTGLPVVFDALHDAVLPSPGIPAPERLHAALDTWPRGRTPKAHYSDQDPTKRPGAHAPRVDPARFRDWVRAHAGARAFDVMVEAKDKELAVLPLVPAVRAVTTVEPPVR